MIITCTFFLITSVSFSQSKGDNTILVKGVTFEQVVNKLLDQGYRIDKIDKDYKTVKTEYSEPRSGYTYKECLDIRVKDSVATITGKASNLGLEINIEYQKWGGLYKLSFEDMNQFAKSLNGQIAYLKNKRS